MLLLCRRLWRQQQRQQQQQQQRVEEEGGQVGEEGWRVTGCWGRLWRYPGLLVMRMTTVKR